MKPTKKEGSKQSTPFRNFYGNTDIAQLLNGTKFNNKYNRILYNKCFLFILFSVLLKFSIDQSSKQQSLVNNVEKPQQ